MGRTQSKAQSRKADLRRPLNVAFSACRQCLLLALSGRDHLLGQPPYAEALSAAQREIDMDLHFLIMTLCITARVAELAVLIIRQGRLEATACGGIGIFSPAT